MKLNPLDKSKENFNLLSLDSVIDSSTPISLTVCAVFLALVVLAIAFFVHRRRSSQGNAFGQPVVQQVLSHGSLFASRCTQTRIATAQPKPAPNQATATTAQCATAASVCAVQQQLSQNGSQSMVRPQTFAKPTAIKSPSSGYIKKSPSPTGQKSPPRENATTTASVVTSSPDTEAASRLLTSGRAEANKEGHVQVVIETSDRESVDTHSSVCLTNETQSEMSDENEKDMLRTGRLHFKLKYSYEKHSLCVSVVRCEQLQSKGSIDPYVKLQLLPDKTQKAKTKVIRKTNSPTFDEEFTFFNIQPSSLDLLSLHFSVFSFDRYSRNEMIGEIVHHLDQTHFDTLEKQVCLVKDLYPKGARSKNWGRGELLISLCFQPAANRLTVVVLKARNLPKMDLTGLSDPYVKLYLLHNGQRIAKKKTHVKKRTLNPVFNESFVFDLPASLASELNEDGSKRCETDASPFASLSLELVLLDYDRMSRNETIGRLILNCEAEEVTARQHWIEVSHSPRRQIAEWHRLNE